eukprot:SAG11_NODE_8078_length_1062_cov_1.170301_1_plen_93_part_00
MTHAPDVIEMLCSFCVIPDVKPTQTAVDTLFLEIDIGMTTDAFAFSMGHVRMHLSDWMMVIVRSVQVLQTIGAFDSQRVTSVTSIASLGGSC